jgi:hypothetical protein
VGRYTADMWLLDGSDCRTEARGDVRREQFQNFRERPLLHLQIAVAVMPSSTPTTTLDANDRVDRTDGSMGGL